ncbi:hypothetical protein Hanom_Chr05g00471611 [Helianthus anomalus]
MERFFCVVIEQRGRIFTYNRMNMQFVMAADFNMGHIFLKISCIFILKQEFLLV